MGDRNSWGQYVDKGEAGTMRAAEVERREAMQRRQEEQDRQARDHQRRMEAEQDRQRLRDRQIQSKQKPTPATPSRNKHVGRTVSKPTAEITSSIGKLSLFLAIVAGIYSYSQPQFQADALGIAFVILAVSFVGLHIVYYAMRAAFFLVKWALAGVGVVFIFYLIIAVFGNA